MSRAKGALTERLRRRARSSVLGMLRRLAPQTQADLAWLRVARSGGVLVDQGGSVSELSARVDATAESLAHLKLSLTRTGDDHAEFGLPTLPRVYRSRGKEGAPRIAFHVADESNNGVSTFAARTLPLVEGVSVFGYGDGPIGTAEWTADRCASPNYDVEVFVLGNSPAHLPVLRECLTEARSRRRVGATTALYLHDVAIKYLLELYFGAPRAQDMLRQTYGSGIDRLQDSSARLMAGMSGVRLVAALGGVDHVIVHEAGTARLLGMELQGVVQDVNVHCIAHPDLSVEARSSDPARSGCCPDRERVVSLQEQTRSGLRLLGAFGIPFAWKRPGDFARVVDLLVEAGDVDGGVIVGWGAEKELATTALSEQIQVLSDSCTPCLMDLMRLVRTAVQLRGIVGGEASGVLAQLLSLGTPVVSARTAGGADGDSVLWISPFASVEEIAKAVSDSLASSFEMTGLTPPHVDEYVKELARVLALATGDQS